MTRLTLLAGGVGGAKMAEGFNMLKDVELTIIGNVADDDEFHGLWVSPDIDTIIYTLSGKIDRAQGWGVTDEGHRALDVLKELGKETWMFLGDRDFGLHIYRTERLRNGDRPSSITNDISKQFGISANINLPTDDKVQTKVRTIEGWQTFQEYFVRDKCIPEVLELYYDGLSNSSITSEAETSIINAELIVFAPSNPLVSITPIIEIPGFKKALRKTRAPIIAVSPLIAGKVVKGPADKMLSSLGYRPDVLGIAEYYQGIISHLLIDEKDCSFSESISSIGITPHCKNILMADATGKKRLAREIIEILQSLETKV